MRLKRWEVCHEIHAIILLAVIFFAIPTTTWAKISKCRGPQPGAGVYCPRICVEYETDIMKVGQTQTVTILGGIQPYQFYSDQGWETFSIKPMTHNSFSVTSINRTVGSGGRGWAQFNFEDSKKCPSGTVQTTRICCLAVSL